MSKISPELSIRAIPGIPQVSSGDNIITLLLDALRNIEVELEDDDILVVSSKIVSKSEGCYVNLEDVTVSDEAQRVAGITGKDPRMVQVILSESTYVSRSAPNVLVTQHRLGFVSANAGIDQSNVGQGENVVLLLPRDPDSSAKHYREQLKALTGKNVGIVISDTQGRPFRLGNTGAAIGIAGVTALLDLRGTSDMFGRTMQVSQIALGDLLASAAHLISGEGAEGYPVVLIRGLHHTDEDAHVSQLYRSSQQDLYR